MISIRRGRILICCLLLTAVPVLVSADPCAGLKQQIKQERGLLKKRTLLDQARQQCPEDADVYYLGAYAAERLRQYEKAMTQYLRATELNDAHVKAYFGLGDIYMVLGNAAAAIRAFERGLALQPENQRAQSSLELARIKHRSASGGTISSAEFIQVMQESKSAETTAGAIDGPILRMQIQFQMGSAELSAAAHKQLNTVGQALQNPALAEARFEIAGHTDDTGTPERNLQLSRQRAGKTRAYLLQNFALDADKLSLAYFGETRPTAPNTTPENRALNRRVEFKKLK